MKNRIDNDTLVIIGLILLSAMCIVLHEKDGMLMFGGGLTGFAGHKLMGGK